MVDDGLLALAPAKINLSLLIAGKRPDGFHEIETIMAKVNWFDEILIQKSQNPGIELLCKGPYWAPEGRENLIYRACELVFENCHLRENLRITLTKNIPAGTGLGSASSDAATTLMALNRFLKLEIDNNTLAKMAATLGSDVAFFLGKPLAFCTGKGEKTKKIEKKFNFLAVLALPNVSVSTAKVYANYKHDAALYKVLNSQINALLDKNNIDLIAKMCANMLEKCCFRLHKKIAELKVKIESFGFGPWCLSGSGSVIFYIVDNEEAEKANDCQRELEGIGCKSVIVSNNRW